MTDDDMPYGWIGGVIAGALVALAPPLLANTFRDEDCVVPPESVVAFIVLTAIALIGSVSLLVVRWRPGRRLARGIAVGYLVGVIANFMWLGGGC